MMQLCFYSPSQARVIDLVDLCGPEYSSQIRRHTIEQVRVRFPDACLMTLEAAMTSQESHWRTEPAEIPSACFTEMLEVLPPVRWEMGSAGQTFELGERLCGRMVSYYAKLKGGRCYQFVDVEGIPHASVMARLPNAQRG